MRPLGASPSPEVMELLGELAAERQNRLNSAEYDATTWTARSWMAFSTQRLSVALHRAVALEIATYFYVPLLLACPLLRTLVTKHAKPLCFLCHAPSCTFFLPLALLGRVRKYTGVRDCIVYYTVLLLYTV